MYVGNEPSPIPINAADLEGTLANDQFPTGAVVQSAYAENAVHTSVGVAIPEDDTIPQNTEGVEFLTVSITPRSSSNRLRVKFFGYCTGTAALHATCALFRDSAASALHAGQHIVPASNFRATMSLTHELVAGSTASTTFKIRVGHNGGGATMYMNGTTTGRLFGGVALSTLIVEEIKA